MNEKTRLTISIPENARASVPLVFRQSVAHGVWVNWGDDDYPETFEQAGIVHGAHTYAAPGTYVIEMCTVDDCVLELGGGSPDDGLFGGDDGYRQMLIAAEIGKDVCCISRYAFSRCGNLEEVSLPEGLCSIGEYAFDGCYSLKSVEIPDGMAEIRAGTFFGCTALESAILSAGIVLIGNYAFYNCCALSEVDLSRVEEVGDCAFQACRKLQTATLSPLLKELGKHAFEDCAALKEISLPEGIKKIGERVFSNCRVASRIVIPRSVKVIATEAFENCAFAREVTVLSEKPPVLESPYAFRGIAEDCVIRVPSAAKALYEEATNWIVYKTRMEVTAE